MYIKKTYGSILPDTPILLVAKGLLDFYNPPTTPSLAWLHWVTQLDFKTCLTCRNKHGEIYSVHQTPSIQPPMHPNCRCKIKAMDAVLAGDGTKDGQNGADWWIKNYGVLPAYYISEYAIINLGWRRGKSPIRFAAGRMITMGVYQNKDGHLPHTPGRIWYEADINYYSGKRNGHRLLWSNDGLIFVTYDHYQSFLEVI